MAPATGSWAVHCMRCDARLVTHDHVTFVQDNERAMHLGLRRACFAASAQATTSTTADQTLRSTIAPESFSFTKTRQTNVTKIAHTPFMLMCPSCQFKVGVEFVMDGWHQAEHLFDSKAVRVYHEASNAGQATPAELVVFKKFAQLFPILMERFLPVDIRSPLAVDAAEETSDGSDVDDDAAAAPRPKKQRRVKTREAPPPAMVWPTAATLRDHFFQTHVHGKLSTLRDYQMELALGALLENTIVYLPTGCGKTLVAVTVIAALKHFNPQRRAVFLVPTVPLVSQQASYLRREAHLKVLELSGQRADVSSAKRRREKLKQADALVVTAQFFLNMLDHREVLLEQFCVLVFDEAHHATGVHPYSDILRRVAVIGHEQRPRIVALTASPFGQKASTLSQDNTALRKLCIVYDAKLNTPTIADSASQLKSVFKQVEWVPVAESPIVQQLRQGIKRHVRAVRDILRSLPMDGSVLQLDEAVLAEDMNSSDALEEIYHFCGKLRHLQTEVNAMTRRTEDTSSSSTNVAGRNDVSSVLRHMRRLLMVLPQLTIQGPLRQAEEVRDYFGRIQQTEPRLFDLVKASYIRHLGTMLTRTMTVPKSLGQDDIASKVQQVALIVESVNFNKDSRAIVFVRRRKTAIQLATVMESLPILKELNPTRFVGHNSYEGMSWDEEQRPTLERFRRGWIRMLVATSVLEEGLDVPECSLVIQFDGVTGMTSLVQSRGRARQATGKFVVFCGPGKREKLQKLIDIEFTMFELAIIEAKNLPSKPATQQLLHELATSGALQRANTSEVTSLCEQQNAEDGIDWSQLDRKFCVVVGAMVPGDQLSLDDQHAALDAIRECETVEVDMVEPQMGLVVLESLSGSTQVDHSALYEEICRRVSFHLPPIGSFWLKMLSKPTVAVPPSLATTDPATFLGNVLVEEPGENSLLYCDQLLRGRFQRHGVFEPGDMYDFKKFKTATVEVTTFFIIYVEDQIRFEFDLCAVHERVVWLETTSATEWTLYLTLYHAPKLWDTKEAVRFCGDFHMKALSFAVALRSASPVAMRMLRKNLMEQGLDIRDTRMSIISLPPLPPQPLHGDRPPDSMLVTYALQSLLSSCCFAVGSRLPEELLDMVHNLDGDALRIQALRHFDPKSVTEDELVVEFRQYISQQWPALKGLTTLKQKFVLKAFVTPSRILFERSEVAPSNRVFRNYGPEQFLYVYFRDENRERLEFSDSALAQRARLVLEKGICIGTSHFQFLGCSLSQLRNGSCVLTVLDPFEVRRWMGELHHIKTPAKYLKRMGQAFSSTRESIAIHPRVLLHPHPDIVDEAKKYEFTDGCGEITSRAALSVTKMLKLKAVPSAFQIRLGGAKGVLVVSDFEVDSGDFSDGNKEEKEEEEKEEEKTSLYHGHRGVKLRKSMVKFKSPHTTLEVVAHASAHSIAFLSRQSILILSDLKIADEVFLRLQDEFIDSLAVMVVSDRIGLQELRAAIPPEEAWWLDVLYGQLAGENASLDPIHRRMIHTIYQYKLPNTVLRARIPVAKGRNLMGVADFTGTLRYGEIFVQYSERDPSGVDGLDRLVNLADIDVLVHRSPCHHPGDLRVLRCRSKTTVPQALRDLRDCVVFPTCGPRPHPDECTGGDLDGDVFTVIWDERLIPPPGNIVPAMVPTEGIEGLISEERPQETQAVDVPQLIDFYLFVLANDILGIASNAHLAVSDADLKLGCFGSDALVLAEVCSREVDCCKNAKHAELVRSLSPKKYPDFMQNSEKPSYTSQKVLGKMYRRALALLSFTKPSDGGTWEFTARTASDTADESFLTDRYLKYSEEASILYQEYKHAIRMLLNMCGAVNEAELATGMIIEVKSEYKADYFRFGERCRDAFYKIQRDFRDKFQRVYGVKSNRVQRRVAAAWYDVAYKDKQQDRLLSFPWILADLLITNKSMRCSEATLLGGLSMTSSLLREVPIVDVTELTVSKLQLCILNEVEQRYDGLLHAFHDRLQALTALRLALLPHFGTSNIGCVLFGSSALLTFEEQSDLDLVLSGVANEAQLKSLAHFVESVDDISNINLIEKTHVPVLSMSFDSNWTMEISTARTGPIKTAWFRAYMVKYPFFWPTVFFLIKWGKAADLIRRKCVDGNGQSMLLPIGFLWLFLKFCLDKGFVERIECPVDGLDSVDVDMELAFWKELLQRAYQSSTEPSAAQVMLAFFSYFGDLATPESAYGFDDELDPNNNTRLAPAHTNVFKEQCYVAWHHLVVSGGDLVSLLRHQKGHRRRITLSRALSKHVHASPEFYAAKILRESGVLSANAKLSFAQHPNALRPDLYVADVVGDGESVHRIEQKIERIEQELGAPQTRRSTDRFHRAGCCLLLFEGAPSQKDKIGFQEYISARHIHHEHIKLHQAHLACFMNSKAWLEHAVASFAAKFMRQMVKLSHYEKLNPGVATAKAIVRFGHHYLIHLPLSFHEESIALATIEMLEQEFERGRVARELYESVLVARRRDKKDDTKEKEDTSSKGLDDQASGGGGGGGSGGESGGGGGGRGTSNDAEESKPPQQQRKIKALTLQKACGKSSPDRGVAHSFYPMIDSQLAPSLDDFAIKCKQMVVVSTSESYQVSIVRDSFDFNVRLTPTLELVKVKTRPCRWFSATLKMRQELLDDRSRMDATPDVRYYVSSTEDVPSSDMLPQLLERACAKAKNGHGVLEFTQSQTGGGGANKTPLSNVRISSELLDAGVTMSSITNVRHMRCTTYKCPVDGVQLRVQKVVEYALPSADLNEGFLRVTPKTEAEIVMPPLSADVRVDAGFARRFLLAGLDLVQFLRLNMHHRVDSHEEDESKPAAQAV